MTYAVLFPGQGSQEVGMGAELFDARPDLLVDTADDVLGWSLRDVCLNGPIELLTQTDRAQPALFALSYVQWVLLNEASSTSPAAAAGHSLGEYTALAAAGALSFDAGLRLVAARGTAMQDAAAASAGGMAALLGADDELAEKVAAERRGEGGDLWVANYNAPGQVVLAGTEIDIDWLVENAREVGVRRAVKLNVAGAFHSPMMEPAVAALQAALDAAELSDPAFDVWANASAAPIPGGGMRDALAAQITSPVRFSASLAGMASSGVSAFVHVGPGDVTAGMAKRAAAGSSIHVVNSMDAMAEVVAALEDVS